MLFLLQRKDFEMAEDKGVTEVTPEDNDDVDEPEGSKSYDAEYVKNLKAEAKKYRQDKSALKKEFDEVKAKLQALEAEKLTDVEKKEKRIAELEKELTDIQGSIKVKEVDNLILKSISGKNLIDTDAAILLIKKELESEEEIDGKVITKAVDKLIKDKPYLVSSGAPNPSGGNFTKSDNNAALDEKTMWRKFLKGK